MKNRLLAIGLAAAALAAAPAFASSPPPTAEPGLAALATADPPSLTVVAGAKDVNYTMSNSKSAIALHAAKKAGSLELGIAAREARSPIVVELTATKVRSDLSDDGYKALAQKKAPEGTAKKLLAASAGHPGIGIAWTAASAANDGKAGDTKYLVAASSPPEITFKIWPWRGEEVLLNPPKVALQGLP